MDISESQQPLQYRLDPEMGICRPSREVVHREDAYDPKAFELLRAMQEHHFWYRGRHGFLKHAYRAKRSQLPSPVGSLNVVDLGGGCGGWIKYLHEVAPDDFSELALADSSIDALKIAAPLLPDSVTRYQIDLLRLGWRERWDAAFLLDVLEHIPEDAKVLAEIASALKPGGLLFVTTPALKFFWSYNDVAAQHVRRYSRDEFATLELKTGLKLVDARYFMFLLSPLLWLHRRKPVDAMSPAEMERAVQREHRIPNPAINLVLQAVFSLETPIGHWMRFPWGTSILAIFRRPTHPE